MSSIPSRWRAPVTGAVAGLVVAAAVLGPSALASSGHSASGQASRGHASALAGAKRAHATDASCTTSAAGAKAPAADQGPGPGPFLDAVAQLKQAGTITDAQAHVIDSDIQAGSIDPQQLVASGTLTAAQMQVVNDRLVAVKRGLAAANGDSGAPGPEQAKPPQG